MRGNLLILFAFPAFSLRECSPSAPPASAPTAPIPAPAGPEAAPDPCVQACLEQSQMEARAWEAIVADCERTCGRPPGTTLDKPL